MRFTLLVSVLVLASALTLVAASEGSSALPPALSPVPGSSEQVKRGAELYDWNCAVCHGDTALGFAEAREAFPEDHRRCQRCHKPNNPARMSLEAMSPHNAFSVGDPPALRGEGTLQAFPHALALYSYIRATMPRYEPGRLNDSEYWDITAFLLELSGHSTLDEAGAALVTIATE